MLKAAKVIFSGIKQNPAGVASYVDFLANSGLDDTNIPANFQNHIKKARERDASLPHAKTFLKRVRYLARVVSLFACVVDVESCAEMPIMMDIGLVEMEMEVISACRNPKGHSMIAPQTTFFGLVQLLSADTLQTRSYYSATESYNENSYPLFLCSDFGWSIFLDVVGDKDPEDVKPHLIHIKKGVPTDARTNERKLQISDSPKFEAQHQRVYRIPPANTKAIVPHAIAEITKRTEFWTTRPQRFEMMLIMTVTPTKHSPLEQFGMQPEQDTISYRSMHNNVWETYVTPACDHPSQTPSKTALQLAPDAIAIWGWSNAAEAQESGPYPQRVVIFLTRGDPRVRWLAVHNAIRTGPAELCDRREAMLRSRDCCDQCALEHVFSLPGRWTLIL